MEDRKEVILEKYSSLIMLGPKGRNAYYLNIPTEFLREISRFYNVDLIKLIQELKARGMNLSCKLSLVKENNNVKIVVEMPKPEELALLVKQ